MMLSGMIEAQCGSKRGPMAWQELYHMSDLARRRRLTSTMTVSPCDNLSSSDPEHYYYPSTYRRSLNRKGSFFAYY